MEFLLQLLIKTCAATLYFTGAIILVGLLLGILRNSSMKNYQMSFGRIAIMITGIIGVPIHELSHALFAVLFTCKIKKIKLFQKPDEKGVMGYVSYLHNPRNIVQKIYQQIGDFFIGIAPIFGGIFSIMLLMRVIIPETYTEFIKILLRNLKVTTLNESIIIGIISSYGALIKSIFVLKNFGNPYYYIFLFVAICISSHISLSIADMKGASKGLGVIFLIVLVINLLGISKYIGAVNIIRYNVLITGFLVIALILSLLTYLLSLIFKTIKR